MYALQSPPTAGVDRLCHGVFVLVDEVLRNVLLHELVRCLGHPNVDEGCEIEKWLPVERELVVNNLVGGILVAALPCDQVPCGLIIAAKRTVDGIRYLGIESVP